MTERGREGNALEDVLFGGVRDNVWWWVFGDGFILAGELNARISSITKQYRSRCLSIPYPLVGSSCGHDACCARLPVVNLTVVL